MSFDDPPDRLTQLVWLSHAVDVAGVAAISDRQMMAALRGLFAVPRRKAVVEKFERRLASWSGGRHAWVAASLARLHGQHGDRSDASRRLDQLLVRLLHQVRGSRARTLARTCLVADRLLRRRAAWAYFARHGLDPEAAAALASRDPEDDRDYIRFVTRAPAAVAAVSLERVLGVTDAFYWQSCAIATALSADPAAVRRVAGDHPAQTLVAIRNAGTPADLDLARHLLRAHGDDDLDVLTSAIRCFAALRATDDLEPAVARGRDLLAAECPTLLPGT